jgi:hypothetical protein
MKELNGTNGNFTVEVSVFSSSAMAFFLIKRDQGYQSQKRHSQNVSCSIDGNPALLKRSHGDNN